MKKDKDYLEMWDRIIQLDNLVRNNMARLFELEQKFPKLTKEGDK